MAKTRFGFISNSSSSSFIVISNRGNYGFPDWYKGKEFVVDNNTGETGFGWGPRTYCDFGSKLIFAYFQAEMINKTEWINLLEEVVKEGTGASSIVWKVSTNDEWDSPDHGYIDHQSASIEYRNIEMFDSKETLKDFLFNSQSYIELDNDNH
jgi:hypothetical protein